MDRVNIALLRGVCQMPAYVAKEQGFFAAQGIDVTIHPQTTAWAVPDRLIRGELEFAVIPWTRVAAAHARGSRLVLICGSGCEEAALVVRAGLTIDQVRTVAIPQRGGIKDLTANALIETFGWSDRQVLRFPSGDATILALVGQGADAASMVEPYATMLEQLGMGTVVKRTGDVWPGAPGCSLATSRDLLDESPDLVRRMVAAFVTGARFVETDPDRSAEIAAPYIGAHAKFIRRALAANRPNVHALANRDAMNAIIERMCALGYIEVPPTGYTYLEHLEDALTRS